MKYSIDEYASKTIEYLKSDIGRKATYENTHKRRYSAAANLIMATMTVTHIRKYETLQAIAERVLAVSKVEHKTLAERLALESFLNTINTRKEKMNNA